MRLWKRHHPAPALVAEEHAQLGRRQVIAPVWQGQRLDEGHVAGQEVTAAREHPGDAGMLARVGAEPFARQQLRLELVSLGDVQHGMRQAAGAGEQNAVALHEAASALLGDGQDDRHRPGQARRKPVVFEHAFQAIPVHEAAQGREGAAGDLFDVGQFIVANRDRREALDVQVLGWPERPADQGPAMRLDPVQQVRRAYANGMCAAIRILLELLDDLHHHPGTVDGILADGRFRRQDKAVGAVHQGIVDVVDFGPRRGWRTGHRLQQVRCDIDLRAMRLGVLNDHLLDRGNLLDRNLPGQVATVDQDRVRFLGDCSQIVQTAQALDLGDDDRIGTGTGPDQVDVRAAMGEGKREMAHAHPGANRNGCEILFGQRRHRDHALHRDCLVLADLSAIQDPQDDFVVVLLHDLGQDSIEVDADEIAEPKLVDDVGWVEADAGLVARCRPRTGGQEPALARDELAVYQRTGADLRAFGIEADWNGSPPLDEIHDPLDVLDLHV